MFGRDRIVRTHLRQRFIVTMKSGDAFEGLLWDSDAGTLILADAHIQLNDGSVPADGFVFLSRMDVAYMQLPKVPTMLAGELAR